MEKADRVQKIFFQNSTKDRMTHFNITAGIYLFKVNNKNTRARCEIYSKLTIKTPERHH